MPVIDTRREAREAKAHTVHGPHGRGGSKFAKTPQEELTRRTIAAAKRQQDRAAEIRQTKDAVERCVDYVHKISPNYNQTFDAYVDATDYRWIKFITDFRRC